MKIGQFTDTFLPVVDGVGRVVSHYAKALGERGESCYVITPHQGKQSPQKLTYEVLEYRSVTLPKNKQYRAGIPAFDRNYRRRIAQIRLDIVHAHSPFIAGREGFRVARSQGIPLVATFHSKYYDDFYQVTRSKSLAKLGVRFIVAFYSSCDQVWAVSPSAAEVLSSYGYKGPIEVVENGTDLQEPNIERPRWLRSVII